MNKIPVSLLVLGLAAALICETKAGPTEVEKSSDDDLSTSETFGYGYYQPRVYSSPLLASSGLPLAASSVLAAPLTTNAVVSSVSSDYARSGYGYNSGYKYGSGYDYGKRWGSGGGVNEVYRRHPVYVAWG